jgi:hypothetical protein
MAYRLAGGLLATAALIGGCSSAGEEEPKEPPRGIVTSVVAEPGDSETLEDCSWTINFDLELVEECEPRTVTWYNIGVAACMADRDTGELKLATDADFERWQKYPTDTRFIDVGESTDGYSCGLTILSENPNLDVVVAPQIWQGEDQYE